MFSYYRLCSHATEGVLLLQNVLSRLGSILQFVIDLPANPEIERMLQMHQLLGTQAEFSEFLKSILPRLKNK